jgi:hypothetical protein
MIGLIEIWLNMMCIISFNAESEDVGHHAGSFSSLALEDDVLDADSFYFLCEFRFLLVVVRYHLLHELVGLLFRHQ